MQGILIRITIIIDEFDLSHFIGFIALFELFPFLIQIEIVQSRCIVYSHRFLKQDQYPETSYDHHLSDQVMDS